LRFIHKSAVS